MTIRKYWKSASAWALMALAVVACNRQDDLSGETDKVASKTEQTEDEPLVEYKVDIDLDADIDLNLPIEGEESPRAFGIETGDNQKIAKLKLPNAGQKVKVMLLFKHKGTPTTTESRTTITKTSVEATVVEGAGGKKSLKISNNPLGIENKNPITLMANGGHSKFNEDGWYVSAIITGQDDFPSGEDVDSYAVSFKLPYTLTANPSTIEMPFVAPWTPVKFNANLKYDKAANGTSNTSATRDMGMGTLHFKPYGSILALKIRSNLADNLTTANIDIKSNEFLLTTGVSSGISNSGFDLRTVTNTDLTSGKLPRYGHLSGTRPYSTKFTIPSKTIASGAEDRDVYYVWMAPVETAPAAPETKIRFTNETVGGESKPFTLKTPTKGYDITKPRCYLTYAEITSDLMITEVFFENGGRGNAMTVVELYNPTLDRIDLRDYALFRTHDEYAFVRMFPKKNGPPSSYNGNSERNVELAKLLPLDLPYNTNSWNQGGLYPSERWPQNTVNRRTTEYARYSTVVKVFLESDNVQGDNITFRPGNEDKFTYAGNVRKVNLMTRQAELPYPSIEPGRTALLFGHGYVKNANGTGVIYPHGSNSNEPGVGPMPYRAYLRGYCQWMIAATNASGRENNIDAGQALQAGNSEFSTLQLPDTGGYGLVKRPKIGDNTSYEIVDVTQPAFGLNSTDNTGRFDEYKRLVDPVGFASRRVQQRKAGVTFPSKYWSQSQWQVDRVGFGNGTSKTREFQGKYSLGTRTQLATGDTPGARNYSASGWASVPDFTPPTRKWKR